MRIADIFIITGVLVFNTVPKPYAQTPEELASKANAAFEASSSAGGPAISNLETDLNNIPVNNGTKGTLEEIKTDISAALHGKDKLSYRVAQIVQKLQNEGFSLEDNHNSRGTLKSFNCDLGDGYIAEVSIAGSFRSNFLQLGVRIMLNNTNVPYHYVKRRSYDEEIAKYDRISRERHQLFLITEAYEDGYTTVESPYYKDVPPEIKNKFEDLTLIAMSFNGRHLTTVLDRAIKYILRPLESAVKNSETRHHYTYRDSAVTQHSFSLGSAGGVSGIVMETTKIYPGGKSTKEWTAVGF